MLFHAVLIYYMYVQLQLQLLGFLPDGNAEVIRPSASHQLFFNNTQHDAFALFQAISAQVRVV